MSPTPALPRFALLTGAVLVLGLGSLSRPASLAAQSPAGAEAPARDAGRIIGRIADADRGMPIDGAQIEVVGSGQRVTAAADGRYALDVPPGDVSLRVRMIGYAPQSVRGISVPAGGTAVQDVKLVTEVVMLEEITVAPAASGSVDRALEEQRNASQIINTITSEQMQRSPDSDAGQALQRVSGVTLQDGKHVFVRGLGERYTTTSLNGARLPSPDPESKVVPLDLFPASLLEAISTSKTFTPDQSGDFSGAQVDLKTKEFPTEQTISFSLSTGINTAATGKHVLQAPSVGGEWLGVAAGSMQWPTIAMEAGDLNGATQSDINSIVGAFRNAWSARVGSGSANGGLGISIGGQTPVLGRKIGYLGSFTYSYGQEIRIDEAHASVIRSLFGDGFEPKDATLGSTARSTVLWGGLMNLSTRVGPGTKLSLNNSYSRTADNEAVRYAGDNEEFSHTLDVTRLTYTERAVRSNQLAGEHLFGTGHLLDWSVTSSHVSRDEPDRSDIAYVTEIDPETGVSRPIQWLGGPRTATRAFGILDETATEMQGNYRILLDGSPDPAILKFGGLFRSVDRHSLHRGYDITNRTLTPEQREAAPEEIFDGTYAANGAFRLTRNAYGGQYDATDRLGAGYVQIELPLSSRLRFIGGARLEGWGLDLTSVDARGIPEPASRSNADLLPAAAFIYRLTDDQNLRFSATRTLSRPEYREIANVSSAEPIGRRTITYGNPRLQRALIQNYDMRWEWYPRAGEVLSIALFVKRFDEPIERVFGNQTGSEVVTFVNAESANNYGVELEARKGLDFLGSWLQPFSAFVNSTLMQSEITPGNEGLTSLTNKSRPMVGQAEYVVNAGLNYTSGNGGTAATLLYNVVGPRITEAGSRPTPDAYERPRHVLDFSLEFPALAKTSLKFQAKNLLDAPYHKVQGEVTRERYGTGRVFSLGATWRP